MKEFILYKFYPFVPFLKNFEKGFISEISTAKNTIINPAITRALICSFVKITENITPKTASRLNISDAAAGFVYFCPTFCMR